MKIFIASISFILFWACGSETAQPVTENNVEKPTNDKVKTMADHTKMMREIEDTFHVLKTDIQFKSLDGLPITASISEISESAPYILLCHQAGYSRGEYIETQEWFNSIGYNTLAIDQRAGDKVNGVMNETAAAAESKGMEMSYEEAEQDIRAAIAHISHLIAGPDRPIFLLGSSYSAGLVLKIAADSIFTFNNQISGILSFSPGEYYPKYGRIAPLLAGLRVPCFVTSSKSELANLEIFVTNIPDSLLNLYPPKTESIHGSRALWTTFPEHVECRKAVEQFLHSNTNR